MKVISIGTDRNLFTEGSAVRARQAEYGKLFEELHIIVFTRGSHFPAKTQIAPNVWVYATCSFAKFTYVLGAEKLVGSIISERKLSPQDTVISVQDPFESSIVGKNIKRKFKLPLHIQIHTDFLSPYFREESSINSIRVKIAHKNLRFADAIRVVSQRIADSLKHIKLKPGVTPTILPIFVDVAKFENAPITVDLKKKYPQFNFVMLMASRLTHEKNIPFALTVFKRILGNYPQAGLIIVGTGPERDAQERMVKNLHIEKSVVFEEWQQDVTSYYKTANLFLLTSLYEGYGMTLVEAIASHCPVVSTDVGIANILLQDGISLVCPIGDSDCFVEKITKLIEDPGLRLNFVQEAGNRLEKVVSIDKQAYLQAYKANIESAFH